MLAIIPAAVTLVIALACIFIAYLLVEWILSYFPLVPPVAKKIVYIVCVVLSVVAVLNFVGAVLGILRIV